MTSSYKSKIIAVGSSNSGKEAFFKSCNQIFSSCCDTSYWTIGLSLKIVDFDSQGDRLSLALWDINSDNRFYFLYPNFFRGASGAIIFLDFSEDCLINDLNYWLEIIRENTNNIPIYLVAIDKDIKQREKYGKIVNFVKDNDLEGIYLIKGYKKIQHSILLNKLSLKILELVRARPTISSLEKGLNYEQKLIHEKFISVFSFCPICGAENHKSYLDNFYFDEKSNSKVIKEELLRLIEKSKRFDYIYENDIKIGIPCCSCFNKIFSNKPSD